jgi:hypothetical protein
MEIKAGLTVGSVQFKIEIKLSNFSQYFDYENKFNLDVTILSTGGSSLFAGAELCITAYNWAVFKYSVCFLCN